MRKAGVDRRISTPIRTVRRALKLGKRDKTHYTIRPSGEVVLTRAEASDVDDPVLGQFLGFLAADIARHPERLQALVPGQVLPAVPPFFPLPRPEQSDRLRLGE